MSAILPKVATEPVVFAIDRLEALRVSCPVAQPAATMLASGVRAEFVPGKFSAVITLMGPAGQPISLRFDRVESLEQLTRALQLTGASLRHFLTRPKNLPSAPSVRPPSRSCSTTPESGPSAARAGGN